MKGTSTSGRIWTLSFSSWEEWVYSLGLPPPDHQQADKCGHFLPLEAGRCSVLSQAMAASGNTHVYLRSQIHPSGSGST